MYIAYPDRDLFGKKRPQGMPKLMLAGSTMKRIVKTIERRRRREPKLASKLDRMERDLWRKAHRALKQPVYGPPSREAWGRLLDLAPKEEPLLNSPSRALMRRRALIHQGLAKSWNTARPLAADSPPRSVSFSSGTWRSPLPKGRVVWCFSPYRLDYYANVKTPSDPKDWVEPELHKRLMVRGRTPGRSPKAKKRVKGKE